MKKSLFIFLFLLINQSSFSQTEIISDTKIPTLNAIIDSLKYAFDTSEIPGFESLPQTTAHFFQLKTQYPDEFIHDLKHTGSLEALSEKFPNLQIDRDLLVIKNTYTTSSGDRKLEIKSFQIENSRNHQITLDYSDSLDRNEISFYYSTYLNKKSNVTNISGFYLNEGFSQHAIPQKYAGWIHYTDILVQPNEPVFYKTEAEEYLTYRTETTLIDSLINYYATVTHKPVYDKAQDISEYRNKMDRWEENRAKFSDSLFNNDPYFQSLLFESLAYAEDKKQSNGELEFFVAHLISSKRALELLRYNQQTGSCSFDNGPLEQQKRMAKLATEIPNWPVFIKAFLNVMNDNVSRVANSNIASNSRNLYIEELTKLNLDVKTLLLGSNMRINASSSEHYFSDGGKIGKAFSVLSEEEKDYFENTIEELIKDEQLDAFNKLHFYNTLSHYFYFLDDDKRKEIVANKIKKLANYMPLAIRTRIENPNKQLTDLLYQERDKLDEFNILDSTIGTIYSSSYSGNRWDAKIQEKNGNQRIIYDLIMPIEDSITPLSNFLEQRLTLKNKIQSHQFIGKLMDTDPKNKLYIQFTGDKSFTYENRVMEGIPNDLRKNLNFQDAISFYIAYADKNYVRYILFENNNLMILGIPKDFSIPGYTFEDLLTRKSEHFLSVSYESYRLFNEEGEMIK